MKYTEHLGLPIYDNPETDLFKIDDVNNAHTIIDEQYNETKISLDSIKQDFDNHIENHPSGGIGGTGDGHLHSNKTVLDGITSVLINNWNNKANQNHTHSDYAGSNHSHIEYSEKNHIHNQYSDLNHQHEEYSNKEHTHVEYSSIYHTHDVYQTKSDILLQTNNKNITGAINELLARINELQSGGGIVNVTSITLNKTSISLLIGEEEQLIANILPSNATNKTVTWSSNNTSIATVIDGKVKGIGSGSCSIIATTVDGSRTSICEVTIKQQLPELPDDIMYKSVAYVVKPWEDCVTALEGIDMYKNYTYGTALMCLPVDCMFTTNSPKCDVTETMINTICDKAESLGLRPILKMHTVSLEEDGQGNVEQPENAQIWFANYRVLVNKYADYVVKRGYKEFIISNELNKVTNISSWKQYFVTIINDIKAKGLKVSCSVNYPEVIENDGFQYWDELDFFSLNLYVSFTDKGKVWAKTNRESLREGFYTGNNTPAWARIQWGNFLANLGGSSNLNKDIWLTEVGCIPNENGLMFPASWAGSSPYDEEIQKIYMDVQIDILENDIEAGKLTNRIKRYMLWDGNSDSDFNIVGKQAEDVIKKYWQGEDIELFPPTEPSEENYFDINSLNRYPINADISIDSINKTLTVTSLFNDYWDGYAVYEARNLLRGKKYKFECNASTNKSSIKIDKSNQGGNIYDDGLKTTYSKEFTHDSDWVEISFGIAGRIDENPMSVVFSDIKITEVQNDSSVSVTGITISSSSHTFKTETPLQLTSNVLPSNATNKSITWSSSDIRTATVSQNGLVIPNENGSCIITATSVDGNYSNNCNVIVDIDKDEEMAINYFNINSSDYVNYKSSCSIDSQNNKVTVTSVNEGGIDGYVKWRLPMLQPDRNYRLTCTTNDDRNFIRVKSNGSTIISEDKKTTYNYTFIGKDGADNLIDLEMGIRYRGDTSTTPISIIFSDIKIIDIDGDPDLPTVEDGLTFSVENYKITVTDGTNTEVFDACCEIPTDDSVKGYKTIIKDRVAYYLPLSDTATSSFTINGYKPFNHGHIDEVFKSKFSNRAYAYVQNKLKYTIANRVEQIDVVAGDKTINQDALTKSLYIYNCAIPEYMEITQDQSSVNSVSEAYFTDEFFGVCRLKKGDRFHIHQNTRFLGANNNDDMYVGVLVHELGHTTGIWDDSPHMPSMYSYDRNWAKTMYLQPSDIKHIKDKYPHLTGGTKSTKHIVLNGEELNVMFEFPTYENNSHMYSKADIVVDTEYVSCLGKYTENDLTYNLYTFKITKRKKGNKDIGEIITVKIHESFDMNLTQNNNYTLYLANYENSYSSLLNPNQSIIKM